LLSKPPPLAPKNRGIKGVGALNFEFDDNTIVEAPTNEEEEEEIINKGSVKSDDEMPLGENRLQDN
jgi:hypothetical protein